jgi:hypothetical protein
MRLDLSTIMTGLKFRGERRFDRVNKLNVWKGQYGGPFMGHDLKLMSFIISSLLPQWMKWDIPY